MIELLFRKLGRQRDENAAAGAVVAVFASLTILRPFSLGFAPAQSGTVSMWVMNMIRGWLCMAPRPGRSTMRLPVSVGTGMRVLASSRRIALAGTPLSCSAALSSRPIAASFPVTPSTARKRMRRSVAAWVSTDMMGTLSRLAGVGSILRDGSPRKAQGAA